MNIPSERRIDYTKPENYLPIYTIDPEGCEDADDAFSLVERNGQILLYIHIADPTDEFSPNDELFHRIVSQGTTKYSLHSAPNHLFPRPLVIK
jgi:ribonuclease R